MSFSTTEGLLIGKVTFCLQVDGSVISGDLTANKPKFPVFPLLSYIGGGYKERNSAPVLNKISKTLLN